MTGHFPLLIVDSEPSNALGYAHTTTAELNGSCGIEYKSRIGALRFPRCYLEEASAVAW